MLIRAIHGETPVLRDLVAVWVIFCVVFILTFQYFGTDMRGTLLAFIAADWSAGIVANASYSIRAWWRERPKFRVGFYALHLLEIPFVWLLLPNIMLLSAYLVILIIKLVVFSQGSSKAT